MRLSIDGKFLVPPKELSAPATETVIDDGVIAQIKNKPVRKVALGLATISVPFTVESAADLEHRLCDALLLFIDLCRREGVSRDEALLKGALHLSLEEEDATILLLDAAGEKFPLSSSLAQVDEIYMSAEEIAELVAPEPVLTFN